jgi:saccharopine dehydrogenase (NAD+, L-lysine-forming)
MKIGIIKEGKVPPDFRVALTPKQCRSIIDNFSNVEVFIQKSPIRTYSDAQYEAEGLPLVDTLEHCDVIIGVKEVNLDDLIPNKTFMFFSHTFKKQSYNRVLLQEILNKNVRLIDYEVIKDERNVRLIGFGRYAGIVGCYNGFRTYGLKNKLYNLKPANECQDRKEVEAELKKVKLPNDFKMVLTGFGRVGHGAREIMNLLPIREVKPYTYLNKSFSGPVFTHLEVENYFDKKDGSEFIRSEFYNQPELYKRGFQKYVPESDMYIPCHYWSSRSPKILTQKDLSNVDNRISVVADISCDIADPIASTLRPSKVAHPIYGYDPISGKEVDFMQENAIAVMAVDNLPCELPKDASEDFGNELIKHVLPALVGDDPKRIIERASQTNLNGELMPDFTYLKDYVEGNE